MVIPVNNVNRDMVNNASDKMRNGCSSDSVVLEVANFRYGYEVWEKIRESNEGNSWGGSISHPKGVLQPTICGRNGYS